MPGIAGIFPSTASPVHEGTVRRMLQTMQHRAGSESGTVFAPGLGVYAGWIAHEKSFAARQSTASRKDGTSLLFAGECHSPAALLDLYDAQGEGFVSHLNGLFSGLLVDSLRQRALLFNDRFGSERLYVAESEGTVWFASEAKALLAVLPRARAFDDTAVAQFLAFGSSRDGRTLFRGIRLIPGGSLWAKSPEAALERKRYFTPQEWEELPRLDDATFENRFAETFRRILPSYLVSEVPVGISLTAGLDTRMIMACLGQRTGSLTSYTYAAEEGDTLDVSIARRVAAACGIAHRPLRLGTDFVSNYGTNVDRTVYVTDGCAGATGAHEIYLSERARQLADVRLTGNYGSEVLRSVRTFRLLDLDRSMFEPSFVPALASVRETAEQQARTTHPVTEAVFEGIPWHLFGSLAAARSQLTFRTPYLDNEIVELAYRASLAQRQSSEPALRLIHCYHPALSIIATDRGFAGGQGKLRSIARRAACSATFKLDYWHKEGMPDWLLWSDSVSGVLSRLGLLGLHKFLPYRIWFRRELAPYIREVVTDGRISRLPFLDPQGVRRVVDEHAAGHRNHVAEINAILTLEAIDRMLLQGDA